MNIEKDVPMPEVRRGSEQSAWSTFSKMEVGDSILVDGDSAENKECPAYSSAKAYGHRYGKRFSGRKAGNGKVRIWRVE